MIHTRKLAAVASLAVLAGCANLQPVKMSQPSSGRSSRVRISESSREKRLPWDHQIVVRNGNGDRVALIDNMVLSIQETNANSGTPETGVSGSYDLYNLTENDKGNGKMYYSFDLWGKDKNDIIYSNANSGYFPRAYCRGPKHWDIPYRRINRSVIDIVQGATIHIDYSGNYEGGC